MDPDGFDPPSRIDAQCAQDDINVLQIPTPSTFYEIVNSVGIGIFCKGTHANARQGVSRKTCMARTRESLGRGSLRKTPAVQIEPINFVESPSDEFLWAPGPVTSHS